MKKEISIAVIDKQNTPVLFTQGATDQEVTKFIESFLKNAATPETEDKVNNCKIFILTVNTEMPSPAQASLRMYVYGKCRKANITGQDAELVFLKYLKKTTNEIANLMYMTVGGVKKRFYRLCLSRCIKGGFKNLARAIGIVKQFSMFEEEN